MAKCHPNTNLLEVSVKVGTDTVCTMLVSSISDIAGITTHTGARVTLKTVPKDVHDGTLMRVKESVCNEKNVEIIENAKEYEEPTESNDDTIDSLLRLTARINENIHNGLIPRNASICNTELSVEDSRGGQPENGMVEDGTTVYSQWPVSLQFSDPQLRVDRMLREDLIENPTVVPKEPLMVIRDVAVQQKTGSELLGLERQIPDVRMLLLLLRLNLKWVFWIQAEPYEERNMDRWNMSPEIEEHLASCCVLDRPAVSPIATQGISDQYCVVVFVVTTSLVNPTDHVSWTAEKKASLVPWHVDNQATAESMAMETQASLEQMPVDSKTAAGSKAVENQASLVQGPIDNHTATGSKAVENQASLVQGHVDSKTAVGSKAVENQASLVQGSVGSKTDAGSKAVENQASLVQGPIDNQTAAGSKAVENQASLVQGPIDNQTVAGSKAVENQAFLVQGPIDNQTDAGSKAMENQASLVQGPVDNQTATGSKAVENQASLVQGPIDNQTAAGSKAVENQASLVQGSVGSKTDAGSKAVENQASLVQGPTDNQTAAGSKAVENQASLVQGPIDNQTAAGSKAVENQASLVQGSVGSKTDAGSKAMENQASLVQGPTDNQTATGSKAVENQASLVQGSVGSKTDAGSKAVENQASLVQGPVDNQNAAGSKAVENQASIVQGSFDSQIGAGSKAVEIQASLVQGSVGSKTDAGSKAVENQASIVQGPVDNQNAAFSKAVDNQASIVQGSFDSQIGAGSKAMEIQASLVQRPVDIHTAAVSNTIENQASLVHGSVDSQIATGSKAVGIHASLELRPADSPAATKSRPIENQAQDRSVSMAVKGPARLMPRPVSGQAPTVSMVKKHTSLVMGATNTGSQNDTLSKIEVTETSPASTQPFVASSTNTPIHMEVKETKRTITQVSDERKSFQEEIHTSSFYETRSSQHTCDTELPGNVEAVSRHAVSRRKTHNKHMQDIRKRHRKTKAPSTLRRDRARTQQWIQDKKISIHGEKKCGETSMTHYNSGQLPRQEERTARSCTACVGTLLEHAGNSIDVNRVKENIVLDLGPDQFHDEIRTIYGAMVHLLPSKKDWQLKQLMHAPGTGPHQTCVHHMVRELKAEGKKMGHLVYYFSQKKTKRADIVKLITQIHQCDFCTNTAADVI